MALYIFYPAKFAGGYVQIATDLLGFDETVAMSTSASVREQHLCILQLVLNQWEQAVTVSLNNLSGDVDQSIQLLIAAFSASQNRQDIVACALKSCPDLFNKRSADLPSFLETFQDLLFKSQSKPAWETPTKTL